MKNPQRGSAMLIILTILAVLLVLSTVALRLVLATRATNAQAKTELQQSARLINFIPEE